MNAIVDLFQSAYIIDLETTIESKHAFGASPHDPSNSVVMIGIKKGPYSKGSGTVDVYDWGDPGMSTPFEQLLANAVKSQILLVGHNIKFDLHYIIYEWLKITKGRSVIMKALSNIYVWDTMVAQYYLTNQEMKMPSLETCCEAIGIPFLKNESITESFKMGIGADVVVKEELEKYLIEDINATEAVFEAQHEFALSKCVPKDGNFTYIEYLLYLMSSEITTLMMEHNGMGCDFLKMEVEETKLHHLRKGLEARLLRYMKETLPFNDIKPTSPKQMALYLYGGDMEIKIPKLVYNDDKKIVLYKSGYRAGSPKLKYISHIIEIEGVLPKKYKGFESTDDATLGKILGDPDVSTLSRHCIETLQHLRRIDKELKTYFEGYKKHIYLHDGKIHTTYNHAVTRTKRLSCSNPNLQNASNKEA